MRGEISDTKYSRGPYSFSYVPEREKRHRYRISDSGDNAVGSAPTAKEAQRLVDHLNQRERNRT